MKYINNDIQCGIEYDWRKVKEEFRKLNIPKDVYSPMHLPFDKAKYNVLLSERSRGKTTNILLLGMCMHKLYGTTIEYIRKKEDQITKKITINLFTTILEYDYIEKLTDGKYNSIWYNARRWYYCLVDEDGNVIEKSPTHFMSMLSIDRNETYKSGYNAPRGDFIVYDEFISKYYYADEFLYFTDLLKTIIRDRLSPIIFMLSNMIDKNSEYLDELMISDQVMLMSVGDSSLITTKKGTNIYVELLEMSKKTITPRRQLSNKLYFGFDNPKLINITGGDWVVENYPHIPKKIEYDSVINNIFMKFSSNFIRLEVVTYNDQFFVFCTKFTSVIYDDSIILTLEPPNKSNEIYGLGRGKVFKFIWSLYDDKRFRYQSNTIGAWIDKYVYQYKHNTL